MRTISLSNGIQLTLLTRGPEFLGIGQIKAGEIPLRKGRRPMFVEIRNPSGIALSDFAVEKEEIGDSGIVLDFSMKRSQGGPMDWMLHSVRTRYNTTDWTAKPEPAPDTHLQLEIRPVNRTIGGLNYVGFSYQYRYRSGSIPIYKILDRGSWEPGSRAVGNEIWMRNCFVPSLVKIESIEQFHSTEWYLPDCENPNIFQFLPLQTELQGFTFTASARGILVTWATEVAHVRTLIEKPRGADEIVHWHEHCSDLGLELTTSPMEVLWSPGRLDRVGRANAYEAVRELVHETLHAQLGMRRERVSTYGMIEEWGDPDFERYTEKGVPKLLDIPVKTLGLANHFQNNMNVWGVSNMCCTVDYKFPDGFAPRLKALCDAAKAGGARVEMWGNTSVSSLTEIFSRRNGAEKRIQFLPEEDSFLDVMKKAKAPWVKNPSRAIEADHYTPVFCVMNLRDPDVRAYWLRRWKEAHDEVGIAGIFLDSSFNLSSDKFHFEQLAESARGGATADQTDLLGKYRPAVEPSQAILSQYRAHLDLMTEMQRIGYQYCSEDLGVFGIHRHGPGIEARLDCLPIWAECIANFDVPTIRKFEAEPNAIFFRGLAYRMMWAIYWDIQSDRLSFHHGGVRADHDVPTSWHVSMLRAYNEVFEVAAGVPPAESAVAASVPLADSDVAASVPPADSGVAANVPPAESAVAASVLLADSGVAASGPLADSSTSEPLVATGANEWRGTREILPGEKGVVYRIGDRQIVWAFAALTLPLGAPSRIRDVIMGAESVGTELKAVRHRVYTIDTPGSPARE